MDDAALVRSLESREDLDEDLARFGDREPALDGQPRALGVQPLDSSLSEKIE